MHTLIAVTEGEGPYQPAVTVDGVLYVCAALPFKHEVDALDHAKWIVQQLNIDLNTTMTRALRQMGMKLQTTGEA